MDKKVTIIEAKGGLEHKKALAYSLRELGFKTRVYKIPRYLPHMKEDLRKEIKWGDITVFMGARNSHGFFDVIPDGVFKINYQTEMFKQWEKHNTHQRCEGFDLVLDLYDIHTTFCNSKNVEFFPAGYSPIYDTNQKDLDLLDFYFVGGGTPRRNKKLPEIGKRLKDYRVKWNLGNQWGKKRDLYIKSSKINVYLKARPKQYFAPNHMLMVLCKQKFYLHEKCDGEYGPYKKDLHFIEFEGLDDFIEKFEYWASHDKERDAFTKRAYKDIRENHSMTKYLSEILKCHKILI